MTPEDFLKGRKLDAALLAAMGVKSVSHPKLGQAVAFPYRRGGEVYAAKFRAVEQKDWRSTEGVSRGLYNADVLTRSHELPVVITEGEMDCLSVIQAGYDRAVSLPDGWTEQGNKIEALIAAEDALRAAPFVIVAGDNDKVGESLPRAVANLLTGCDVRAVTWPEGCKDANDVLVQHGEREVVTCLQAARRIDPPGGVITGLSDMPPLSERRVLRVGENPFDWRLAFELGAVSVGTGMPGHGKSTFTTWAVERVSRNEAVRIGMLAFETHPHRIRDQLCRIGTGREWKDTPANIRKELEADWDRRWRLVHRTYDQGAHSLGWLKETIHALAVRDGCKLIVVDPWNELEHLPEPGENMTNYINFALQQIRTWAEKLEVHICLIAHPRKMMTEGKPRAATGYDVADSAAFANKPSLGFTVFQTTDEAGAPLTEIHTWKVRDTQLYQVERGVAQVRFIPATMTYQRL
jgi:twinkle protein